MESVGRFIAYEVQSPNPARTRAFYGDTCGWQVDDDLRIRSHGPQWCRIRSAEASRWIGFVTVPDVDEAVETVAELGGHIEDSPHDEPELGRVAVVRDPNGAWFGLISPPDEGPVEFEARPPAGAIAWNVLVTPDPSADLRFYLHLLGWTAEEHDLRELGTYLVCERDGAHTAGIIVAPPEFDPPAQWLSAVAVTDVAAATEQARRAGAEVRRDTTFIPEIGRFSVVLDPLGARVALLEITASKEDFR